MVEKKMEHNAACESEGHNKHLCHLMYEGFHQPYARQAGRL